MVCTCPAASIYAIEMREEAARCEDRCGAFESCVYHEVNPVGGALFFDWIVPAFSDIFMSITLEGWRGPKFEAAQRRFCGTGTLSECLRSGGGGLPTSARAWLGQRSGR